MPTNPPTATHARRMGGRCREAKKHANDNAAKGINPKSERKNRFSPGANCFRTISAIASNGPVWATATARRKIIAEGTIIPTPIGASVQKSVCLFCDVIGNAGDGLIGSREPIEFSSPPPRLCKNHNAMSVLTAAWWPWSLSQGLRVGVCQPLLAGIPAMPVSWYWPRFLKNSELKPLTLLARDRIPSVIHKVLCAGNHASIVF